MTALEFNSTIVNLMKILEPFALKLTKDNEAAQDLIQETAYKALINREKFSAGTNLKAWLYTIMKNIFINNYRRQVKRNTFIDTTDNQHFINSSKKNVIRNDALANFIMNDALEAIDNLTKEFKVPFMMHYEGYKYQEIADELGLPIGTVKSRIFFARKALKKELKTYQQ